MEQENIRPILEQTKRAVEALKKAQDGLSVSFKALGDEAGALANKFAEFQDKLEQTVALDAALKAKKFTNKDELDAKIREKVISTLLGNFKFEQIKEPAIPDDVVVVDDTPTPPKVEEPQPPRQEVREEIVIDEEEDTPSRDLSAARDVDPSKDINLRRQAKAEAMGDPIGAKMYTDAFNKQYDSMGADPFGNAPAPEDLENITPEELQAMTAGNPELAKKVEALKRLAPKKMGSVGARTSGANKSLSRRE